MNYRRFLINVILSIVAFYLVSVTIGAILSVFL